MWFSIMWFSKKRKEERHQELLKLWGKIKDSEILTITELEEIIKRQPYLMNEAIEELFLREKNFEKLFDLHLALYYEGVSGNRAAIEASRKIAERLIDNYSSSEEFCNFLRRWPWQYLIEKAAGKILQTENVPIKILGEIIFCVNSGALKEKAAEEILKREISDLESELLAWIVARVGPSQQGRALDAMMKRKDWKDNLLLLFNMDKVSENLPFIEKVAKDFLKTNNDNNEDVQNILFSIVEHIKGDVGKKAAERLLSLMLNQSYWRKLSDLIWKCKEYPDLQEIAANETLKREKECCDSMIFCCIIRHVPSPWLKRMAAGVILDRFAEADNLKLIMEKVPSVRKRAKEALEEIELAENEKPKRIFERIMDFKV